MKYVCSICGYVHDEAEKGIPFEELPTDWKCPWCGASKSDFAPQEEKEAAAPIVTDAPDLSEAHELQKLSAGQLAALCSSLARGCEKQYKPEESRLFKELADYFTAITPAVEDATVMTIADALKEEIAFYPSLKATAEAAKDRGAQRVCVWGEKVTRMLYSLINQYLEKGDQMLEGKDVWLCTVCGFVYIGKDAPELCPVCKVPAWKFEKISGRN